ncbi:NUDIX domain-containing protein [Nakamurella aerolata]|uniref:NUDIX hydrolase n=1 Tax=Nakamurella aerolata TaxID=1656892 RepID=A0A849A5D3_9ACTN|nr:NUDIX hydrolase [Nakamurella aerolata]
MSEQPIRRAASVLLLRDGAPGARGAAAGPEVFVLQRAAGMVFAGGMTAFPGGGVETFDGTTDQPDPAVLPEPASTQRTAERFGIDAGDAAAVLAAAVRELDEETGVRLDAEALHPLARWITPQGQPRRYDTFFFLARCPSSAEPVSRGAEAELVRWLRPAEALRQARSGAVAMLPPTVALLTGLQDADSVAAALAAADSAGPIPAITPRVVSAPGEQLRVAAGGREYPALGVPMSPR